MTTPAFPHCGDDRAVVRDGEFWICRTCGRSWGDIIPVTWAKGSARENGPPRCPRCGSYQWIYKGDRQVCADCGR